MSRPSRELDKAAEFLGPYLAGGYRFTVDIVKAYHAFTSTEPVFIKGTGKLKVPNTLIRAKQKLWFGCARYGTEWGWFNPGVKATMPSETDSTEDRVLHELAEMKRLMQPPQATPAKPEDTDTTPCIGSILAGSEAIDLRVDKQGFHERNPFKVSEPKPERDADPFPHQQVEDRPLPGYAQENTSSTIWRNTLGIKVSLSLWTILVPIEEFENSPLPDFKSAALTLASLGHYWSIAAQTASHPSDP